MSVVRRLGAPAKSVSRSFSGWGWNDHRRVPVPASRAISASLSSFHPPRDGGQLAVRLCSNCHLVSVEQSKAVADVPSFKEIANRPGQTEGTIIARMVIPRHSMPVIPITKSELNDLASYIMSLRDPVE